MTWLVDYHLIISYRNKLWVQENDLQKNPKKFLLCSYYISCEYYVTNSSLFHQQKEINICYIFCCNSLECYPVKFIYSEKAKKFCEIFPLLLTVCTVVKSKGKISQNFVAFSEYMNFNINNPICNKWDRNLSEVHFNCRTLSILFLK